MMSNMQPTLMIEQQPELAQPTTVNMYIYDKYAAKYSPNQLNLALSRVKHCGRLTMGSFWLLLTVFMIVVDYLRYDYYIMNNTTYLILSSYDIGVISSLKAAKLGWVIVLATILITSFCIMELLWSRTFTTVSITLASILLFEAIVILITIYKNVGVKLASHVNLAFVIVFCIGWLAWHITESAMLLYQVRKMQNEDEFPQETTIISKRHSKIHRGTSD